MIDANRSSHAKIFNRESSDVSNQWPLRLQISVDSDLKSNGVQFVVVSK